MQAAFAILNSLRTLCTLIKLFHVKDFRTSFEETNQGPFQTVFKLEDKIVSLSELPEDILNERITLVKRCCCSVTGWFPSGVFTIITWAVLGAAARHEFVILHTENYFILIELGGDQKHEPKTNIFIKKAKTVHEKNLAEKELLKPKYWVRDMAVLKELDLAKLKLGQILYLVNIWIISTRAGNEKYSLLQKNCKSLARTILYFCKKDCDYWDVLYSLWGIFTDKPLGIFYHIDMIVIEKTVVGSARLLSEDFQNMVEKTIQWLEEIRSNELGEIKIG